MRLRRLLAIVNGTVIGGVVGLAAYSQLTGGLTLAVVAAAFGGATTASLLTGFAVLPGTFGGVAGGLVGVGIGFFPVPLVTFPLPGLSTSAIGGAVGGFVAGLLPKLR